MSWTIKGEAGHTLDATERALEDLNISSATLKFQSLASDTLTWSAVTLDATGAGTIVPDIGQLVEIFHDGVRRFKGHVTKPVVDTNLVTVTAEGPWWWLSKISITSDIADATGTASERPSYVFETGDHKAHIETLIDRAITLGVPMARGTVASMFTLMRTTLDDQSCASALATMLMWVPDAVTWFDYSGVTPKINISRRAGMTAQTFTIGTDPVEVSKISPRLDLEVSRTELKYVTRQVSTGLPQWATQASGVAVPGKRQILAVSGPEITDYLPRQDFDSVSIQTIKPTDSAVNVFAWIQSADPFLVSIISGYGSRWYGSGTFADARVAGIQWKTSLTGTNQTKALQTAKLTDAAGADASGWYAVRSPDAIPSWVKDLGIATKQGYFILDVFVTLLFYGTQPIVSGIEAFNQKCYFSVQNVFVTSANSSDQKKVSYFVYQATIPVTLISQQYASLTPVYKKWDFDFLTPPAGLADALLAAQNWVPWEGQVKIVSDDVAGENALVKKYNVANALPPCASMGALAKGVTHELLNGRTTIDLGSPARLDFGTLASKIRRSPKDNIVYL